MSPFAVPVRVLDGRDPVYWDDDHLTDYGASLARDRLQEVLARHLEWGPVP